MKNLYLTILGIVTIAAIIIGCSIHMGGFFGFNPFSIFKPANTKKTEFQDSYTGIHSIDIDAKVLNVEIIRGDECAVSYEGNEDLKPIVKADNGILKIEQKSKINVAKNANYKSRMVITIPSDTKIKDASFEMDMGNLNMEDLEALSIDIDLNMGNVTGNNIVAESVDIDANMGNVEINNIEFKKLTADCDMGNVILKSSRDLDDYKIKAESDMGNVELDGERVKGTYVSDGDEGEVELKAGMGNISLSW